jgi:hypothetical protein
VHCSRQRHLRDRPLDLIETPPANSALAGAGLTRRKIVKRRKSGNQARVFMAI